MYYLQTSNNQIWALSDAKILVNILSPMTEKVRILVKLRLVLTFFPMSEIFNLQGRKPIFITFFPLTSTYRSSFTSGITHLNALFNTKNFINVNASVCDPVSGCGHFFTFSSIDEANDEKPYDNHYTHYPERIRIRIDMNCRCEFRIFFKWTGVFYVSVMWVSIAVVTMKSSLSY